MNRHPLLVTFVFIFLCLLPVMAGRDFTPDNELRYLQIADEAISSGHAFAFTLEGQAYADKPPLYLWIVILGKLLLGKHSMLFLSLFSLIPAFVVIWIMDKWAALGKPSERVSVALMMATCALFLGASVFLRMDMLMTMFIVLALYSFWRMYEGTGDRRKHEILLPVWIFLALFTKGPVGLLMPPLAIICFLIRERRGKEIGRFLSWKTWAVIAGLCALWFTGVYLDGGKEYLENLLFHQTMGRAVNSFHHKAPFWYYFGAIWYIAAPYMFLLVGAVVASYLRPASGERSDKEVFFRVSIVSTFVMLSLFSGKLAIYLAPILPFQVLLFVQVLRRTGWKRWMTWALGVPLGLVALLSAAALGILSLGLGGPRVVSVLNEYPFIRAHLVKFALLLLAVGFSLGLVRLIKGRGDLAVIFMGVSMLLAVYSASSVMPRANDWIGWGNLCKTISPEEKVATLYMRRPGPMKVYLSREITDYQKDFDAFYRSEVSAQADGGDEPSVLVTRTRKLDSDPALGEFARSRYHWFVGPYCVVSLSRTR